MVLNRSCWQTMYYQGTSRVSSSGRVESSFLVGMMCPCVQQLVPHTTQLSNVYTIQTEYWPKFSKVPKNKSNTILRMSSLYLPLVTCYAQTHMTHCSGYFNTAAFVNCSVRIESCQLHIIMQVFGTFIQQNDTLCNGVCVSNGLYDGVNLSNFC